MLIKNCSDTILLKIERQPTGVRVFVFCPEFASSDEPCSLAALHVRRGMGVGVYIQRSEVNLSCSSGPVSLQEGERK